MFELPIAVTIGEQSYPIRDKGDYKMILDCFTALNDEQLSKDYRIMTALIIFYEGMEDDSSVISAFGDNIQEASNKMFEFMDCGKTNSVGAHSNYKLLDWENDEQLIAGAINAVAGKEIRLEPYIHWWTFMAYFSNIGEGTFSTVLSIRSKIKKGKKLENYEKEFKRDNPHYFIWDSSTTQDREADEYIRELWNKGD